MPEASMKDLNVDVLMDIKNGLIAEIEGLRKSKAQLTKQADELNSRVKALESQVVEAEKSQAKRLEKVKETAEQEAESLKAALVPLRQEKAKAEQELYRAKRDGEAALRQLSDQQAQAKKSLTMLTGKVKEHQATVSQIREKMVRARDHAIQALEAMA